MSTTGGVPLKTGSGVTPPASADVGGVGGVGGANGSPVPVNAKGAAKAAKTEPEPKADAYATKPPPKASKGGPVTKPVPGSLDEEIYNQVFKPNGIPYPGNSDTSGANAAALRNAPGYPATVLAAQHLMDDPSPAAVNDFMAKFKGLPICGNVMESLLRVIEDSIIDANEDKKFYLQKLQNFNTISQALSDELKQMTEASAKLSDAEKDKKGDDLNNCRVDITVRDYNTGEVGADGKVVLLHEEKKHVSRAALGDATKNVERMQEDVRNNRQMAQTAFQAIDQKVNQLYQIAAGVSKTMNDERTVGSRNLS